MTKKNTKEDKPQKGKMKFHATDDGEIDPFRLKAIDGYNLTKRYGEDVAIRILHMAGARIYFSCPPEGTKYNN